MSTYNQIGIVLRNVARKKFHGRPEFSLTKSAVTPFPSPPYILHNSRYVRYIY